MHPLRKASVRRRMYKVMWFLATGVLLLCLVFFVLSWLSHSSSNPSIGLQNGFLNECPQSPNCVCSDTTERNDSPAKLNPFLLKPEHYVLEWEDLLSAVLFAGGKIEIRTEDYLHATFRSKFFQFVDDLELRKEGAVVHVRSASRVGYSDFGVNRKRVEMVRKHFENASLARGKRLGR